MTTVISPNIQKTSVRIDTAGNVIDARSKQVITPVETEYVPPVEVAPVAPVVAPVAPAESKIDSMISKKIEEIVNRKIEEALKNL